MESCSRPQLGSPFAHFFHCPSKGAVWTGVGSTWMRTVPPPSSRLPWLLNPPRGKFKFQVTLTYPKFTLQETAGNRDNDNDNNALWGLCLIASLTVF